VIFAEKIQTSRHFYDEAKRAIAPVYSYFCSASQPKAFLMITTLKKHNFSAGPAILPASVMEEAAQAVLDFNGMGLSILEISHRAPRFTAVIEEAQQLVRELLELDDRHAVLFLTGGASTQFFMAPMNLIDEQDTAAYVDTGSWSAKAIKEARLFGQIEVVASSKDKQYTYIPKGYAVPARAKYLHITSNNTIFGSQYHAWPDTVVPLVCDMSSDIFSRPLDVSRFDLIYAGAQKNLGPAGVTLVVVRKDALGRVSRKLPTMLDYRTHIDNDSLYNTPPVFPIYVSMLTLRWVKANGGLEGMARRARERADLLYAEIDANPAFKGTVAPEDRSLMNACFLTEKPEWEKPFLEACKAAGIDGIKGHRSVGGFRASMYNALPLESVRLLVDIMREFAQKYAG
jgi:phosphoserine aminotransferase